MISEAWEVVRLGEHCSKIGSGSTPRGGESVYQESGVSLIRSQNVYNGSFATDGLAYLDEEHADQLKGVTVESGDVLLNITGDSVARSCRVPDEVLPARVNQHVAIIRPKPEQFDSRFVGYFFISPFMQDTMLSLAGGGGTRKALTKEMIGRFEVPCPPQPAQVRIADILSAYDDLIENNRRRMALLEEAARQLYREWFVRLRFPGHEHTRITDGVPKGWERKPLVELCMEGDGIQTGPFGSQLHQSDYSEDGVPVVMPKDLIGYRISIESIARIPEELANRLGRHRTELGDTVYGRRGDIGRRAFIGRRQAGWFCGTGCLRIRPDGAAINPRYLFDTLGSPDTAGTIANRAKGATMPNLNSTVLRSVPILVGTRRLQDLYAEHVEPFTEMIELLDDENKKLRAARDLLLPRLMTGQITI